MAHLNRECLHPGRGSNRASSAYMLEGLFLDPWNPNSLLFMTRRSRLRGSVGTSRRTRQPEKLPNLTGVFVST
jgi:hypothetical protein